jgi:hypothetical protein
VDRSDESQGESEYLSTSSGHRALKTNQLCGDRHAFANETESYYEAQWVREGTGTGTGIGIGTGRGSRK